MKPVISIIIPTYNRARDLFRALQSIISQSYLYWEAIVIDNYSSDNTIDVINSFNDSRIKLFLIHNEGVIAASRNLGIKHAQGVYVAFLDSDDWWSPHKLEQSLHYLSQGADIVYHDLFKVKKLHQTLFFKKVKTRSLKSPVFTDLLSHGNALTNSSVVIKMSLLKTIGGFSEDKNLIAMEDFDAWLKIATLTEKFKRIPRTLGYYWSGGNNTSGPERSIKNLHTFKMKYLKDIEISLKNSDIGWLNYSLGRAYYLLGRFSQSKKELEKIQFRKMHLTITLKVIWMIFIIRLFHNKSIKLNK